jgi:hypothetical protein
MKALIKEADVTVEASSSGDRAAGGSYAVPSQVQRVHRGGVVQRLDIGIQHYRGVEDDCK